MKGLFDRPMALTIGPQGCGTGWIEDYVRGRGDVCLPDVKEIFYFDRHFQRGPDFYAGHFELKPQHKIVMELTTTAFDNPDAPDHVNKLLGADVKLICPLRDPVDRARAAYNDCMKYGLVRGGIEEAVEHLPQIVIASRYAENLERWFSQFGRNNVHVIFYEAQIADPEKYARTFCKALGLPFIAPHKEGLWQRVLGTARQKEERDKPLSAEDEKWLRSRLSPEKERLEKLLGISLSYWNN